MIKQYVCYPIMTVNAVKYVKLKPIAWATLGMENKE